ncbi:glycosyltransferase [Flavobacteriaceae bacterium MHTCC 0001]
MISILIPTYNYNITDLVYNIHKQASKLNIEFEIIALDDLSNSDIVNHNSKINTLKNTSYLLSKTNKGIAVNRQLLCEKAKYNWVILLDADMELKDNFFIKNYLKVIHLNYDVFFGGIIYKKTTPNSKSLLRWKYGIKHESISSKERNKKPYKITSASNILIKKETFNHLDLFNIGNAYGMDIFFGPQLKLNQISILHIENEVYHLGLESSTIYLKKVKRAVEMLLKLHQNKKIQVHENSLLKTFIALKKIGLNYLFYLNFKFFKNIMNNNLLSVRPSIKVLQLYKLSYICYKDLK